MISKQSLKPAKVIKSTEIIAVPTTPSSSRRQSDESEDGKSTASRDSHGLHKPQLSDRDDHRVGAGSGNVVGKGGGATSRLHSHIRKEIAEAPSQSVKLKDDKIRGRAAFAEIHESVSSERRSTSKEDEVFSLEGRENGSSRFSKYLVDDDSDDDDEQPERHSPPTRSDKAIKSNQFADRSRRLGESFEDDLDDASDDENDYSVKYLFLFIHHNSLIIAYV